MNKIILIGGGGHCHSVIDAIESTNQFQIFGILDKNFKKGQKILNYEVIGDDSLLDEIYNNGIKNCFITIGSIGNPKIRIKIYNLIKQKGFLIPNIIHKTAYVSNYAFLGEGNFIGAFSFINANVKIGNNCIINSNATIEHDCIIGNHVHIAPKATLCGNVTILDESHIGCGSLIKQNINIGKNTIIGMGSNVISNIGSNVIAYGNPCKEIKNNE